MAKLGLIQVDGSMDADVHARQKALLTLAEKCLSDGADLVFFPEAFQYAANYRELPMELAKKYSDEWMEQCAELARRYHAYVVPWDYYAADDGKVYNSSYILDREGKLIGRYCKCELTYAELKNGLSCGDSIPVFDLDIGRIGIMICFDNYFPEVAATLGNKGAQLILYPLYGDTMKLQWEMKLRARAIDHCFWVAPCKLSGSNEAFTGLVDPVGNIVKTLQNANEYCVIDVDMGREVWSNTSASRTSKGENLREYLHGCRNPKAFADLKEQGTELLPWDKIFY